MSINIIKAPNLQQEIIHQIKNYIYTNKLKPGDMLPSQAAIANMIGTSRLSVREAIRAMEAQNLLRVVNGKGIYVEMIDISFRAGKLDEYYILTTYLDSLVVRKALEGTAVELCTLSATQDELNNINDTLLKIEDKIRLGQEQSDLDYLFHKQIVFSTNNPLLSHLLNNLMQQSGGFWDIKNQHLKGTLTDSIAGHRKMMDYMLISDEKMALHEYNEYMDVIIKDVEYLLNTIKR